ncbi:hypothetical protein ACU635_34355 [[Actinomadura] parvosata]|uniref:hypothetical protein n=1 Tax=[Actinomadura] parvosata TaxID=1955412 RepID=UPI00406C2FB0
MYRYIIEVSSEGRSVSTASASTGWAARHSGVRLQPVAYDRATRAGIAAFLIQHAPRPVAISGKRCAACGKASILVSS